MTFRHTMMLAALLLVVVLLSLGVIEPAHAGLIGLAGMTYDDGSTLTTFDDGSMLATSAPDAGGGVYVSSTDAAEAQKFSQFYPDTGAPWWEQLAKYGATRAVDSHFATTSTDKSSAPQSYAGQNGQTYTAGKAPSTIAGLPTGLVLIAAAAAALLLLK